MDDIKKHPLSGKQQSLEHIAKRVAVYTGKPLSEDHKRKLSAIKRTPEAREKIRAARALQVNNNSEGLKAYWIKLKADPVRYEAYCDKLRQRKAESPVWNKGIKWPDDIPRNTNGHLRGKPNVALIGKPRSDETKEKLRVAHTGRKMPEETKAKISARHKGRSLTPPESRRRGKDHHFFGKAPPKGGGISKGSYCLKGHWVRSTWELAVANWLFQNKIDYQYEPALFDLGDGIRYRPDFYLLKPNIWIEVKGYMRPNDEEKMKRFRARGHRLFLIDTEGWRSFQKTGTMPYQELFTVQ